MAEVGKILMDLCADFTLYMHIYILQSWALALYFQVRSPLSDYFISMDRYRSSAHFANFQVRSLLNRSKKNQWFALGQMLKHKIAPKTTAVPSYVWRGTYICT